MTWLRFTTLTLTLATSVLAQPERTKKVISFSGLPDAQRFHDNVQEMERRMPVVDGVTLYPTTEKGGVRTEALGRLFRIDFHRLEDFDTSIDLMRRARTNLYRHNFLLVYESSGVVGLEVPDWLDPEFDAVVNNWKVAADYARRAGMRGLLFDDEISYGRDLWSHDKLKYRDTTTAEEYYDIVFERGAQIMRAVNTVYPDIHILSIHGPTQPLLLSGGRQADRHYEMIRAFFDGVLSECTGEAAIIDGSGRAYEYKRLWEFERAAGRFRDMRQYSRVPDKWDRHAQIGFPIFIGSHGFSTDDFSANYYSPEELTTALNFALEHTDEYVWIYTHETSLWERSDRSFLPDAYRDAKLAAHDPRQYVTTAVEEEAAEAREKEASERRAAEEKARLEAEQRALEEEHARERRELAEKQRARAAEHAAEKKALAAKKAEAEARAREVAAEARRARAAAEAKAREEADGTYAAGPFLDGTYVKGCAEINQ